MVHGNVPSRGSLITNLPADACVEVPCLVDARGVQPTAIGGLPPQLAALNRTNINVQTLAVRAALEGNVEHVHHDGRRGTAPPLSSRPGDRRSRRRGPRDSG